MLECRVIIFVDTIKTFLVLSFDIIYFTVSSWGGGGGGSGFMCSM